MRQKLTQLEVYVESIAFAKDCFKIADELKDQRSFALANQLERSAISIPSNIAEGNGVQSSRIYLRHVEIALGSAHELLAQLDMAQEFIDQAVIEDKTRRLEIIIRKLFGLRKYLRHKIDNSS